MVRPVAWWNAWRGDQRGRGMTTVSLDILAGDKGWRSVQSDRIQLNPSFEKMGGHWWEVLPSSRPAVEMMNYDLPEIDTRIAPMIRGGGTLNMNHWLPFPLTPALSLGERGNGRQSQSQPMIPAVGRFTVHGRMVASWRVIRWGQPPGGRWPKRQRAGALQDAARDKMNVPTYDGSRDRTRTRRSNLSSGRGLEVTHGLPPADVSVPETGTVRMRGESAGRQKNAAGGQLSFAFGGITIYKSNWHEFNCKHDQNN